MTGEMFDFMFVIRIINFKDNTTYQLIVKSVNNNLYFLIFYMKFLLTYYFVKYIKKIYMKGLKIYPEFWVQKKICRAELTLF